MAGTIPYEKLSKKQKQALAKARRGSWGAISPVTRRPENPKAYNRKKAQRWEKDPHVEPFVLAGYGLLTRARSWGRCHRSAFR